MRKAVLFDLDGTLWDSAPGVSKAWNTVLERHGLAPFMDVDRVHGVMGKQMDEIAAILLPGCPEQEQAAFLAECCEAEHEILAETGGTLYPGLEDTLAALREKYSLGIISNCQCGYIETFFAAHGLQAYFDDYECFGNTGRCKGENISAVVKRGGFESAIYVGDTKGDVEGAVIAGLPFVHAAYEFGQADAAKYRINAITELPALADRLLG